MGPLLLEFLAVVLRWGITTIFAVLVDRHVLSSAAGDHFSTEFGKHALYLAGLLLALGWGLVAKYRGRIRFLTALHSPSGTSEEDVNRQVKQGGGASL